MELNTVGNHKVGYFQQSVRIRYVLQSVKIRSQSERGKFVSSVFTKGCLSSKNIMLNEVVRRIFGHFQTGIAGMMS